MNSRLPLAQKGLLLLTVPLLAVLALIAYVLYLQNDADFQMKRVEHAKAITDATNKLERDIFEMASGADEEALLHSGKFDGVFQDIEHQFDALHELEKGNPEKLATIDKAHASANQAWRYLMRARTLYRGDSQPTFAQHLELLAKLRHYVQGMVTPQLLDLELEEEQTALQGPVVRARSRAQIVTAMVVFFAVVTAVLIWLYLTFMHNVVRRLKVVLHNSMRLATGVPLNPALAGDDEITDLDRAFHKMAAALAEALEKERAVIDNAMDVIYSLDEKGTFVSVNDAAQGVFGYAPAELVGSKFVNLAVDTDVADVVNQLKAITDGANEPPFEMKLKHKCGRIIDILWSARWSDKSRTIFCVAHDISERKQAERLRQEILQMVSHDLRTPLSTVRGFLDMYESGLMGELTSRGNRMLKLARHATSQMLTLTNDLLDVEKMEAGMLQLARETLDLNAVFERVVKDTSHLSERRNVRVVVSPCTIAVYADPDRLNQILNNLITNAIKFSSDGSEIKLYAAETERSVDISVSDQGRGIPANFQSQIFDRFSQVRLSDGAKAKGLGLGLSICKALATLHGGEILLESEEGRGSTFTVSLPKLVAPTADSASDAHARN